MSKARHDYGDKYLTLENFEKKEFSQNRFTQVRKLRLFQSLLDNFANKRGIMQSSL